MKTLVVEDDFTSRLLLQEILGVYGPVHIAINGQEAVEAFQRKLDAGESYNLVCMDIMMPGKNGIQALREIRTMEENKGIVSSMGANILMTSALIDIQSKISAFQSANVDDHVNLGCTLSNRLACFSSLDFGEGGAKRETND